jgi:hypothetical protein
MAKGNNLGGDLTVAVPLKEKKNDEIRVRIMLPKLEDDSNGLNVDQTEHVSISNEQGDNFIRIKRGEWVDVTVETFILLKDRYPNI